VTIENTILIIEKRLRRNQALSYFVVVLASVSFQLFLASLISYISPTIALCFLGLACLALIFFSKKYFSYKRNFRSEACLLLDSNLGSKERIISYEEISRSEENKHKKNFLEKQLLSIIPNAEIGELAKLHFLLREKLLLFAIPVLLLLAYFAASRNVLIYPDIIISPQNKIEIALQQQLLPPNVIEALNKLLSALKEHKLTDEKVSEELDNVLDNIERAESSGGINGDSVLNDQKDQIKESRDISIMQNTPTPTASPTPTKENASSEKKEEDKNEEQDKNQSQEEEKDSKKQEQEEGEKDKDYDVQNSKSTKDKNTKDAKEQQNGDGSGEGEKGEGKGQQKGEGSDNKGQKKGESGNGNNQENKGKGEGDKEGKEDSSSQQGSEGESGAQGQGEGEGSSGNESGSDASGSDSKAGNNQSTGNNSLNELKTTLSQLKKDIESQKNNEQKSQNAEGKSSDAKEKSEQKKNDEQSKAVSNSGDGKGKESKEEPQKQDSKNSNESGKGASGSSPSTESSASDKSLDKKESKNKSFEVTQESKTQSHLREMTEKDMQGKDWPGLGQDKAFKEIEVKPQTEEYDKRFVGEDGRIVRHDKESKAKTGLEDVTLAKPEISRDKDEQQIPLEYRDILR
jgi:flagellar biosynthesis GTPase FlhF